MYVDISISIHNSIAIAKIVYLLIGIRNVNKIM